MNKIKALRERQGMRKKDVLAKVDFSRKSLDRYERGEREPRATDLIQIAAALNCTVDELLREE